MDVIIFDYIFILPLVFGIVFVHNDILYTYSVIAEFLVILNNISILRPICFIAL